MKIGVLTSGGDAPGMNAAIGGVCQQQRDYGFREVIGIHYGTWGLFGIDPKHPNHAPEGFYGETILYNPDDKDDTRWSEPGTVLGSNKDKINLDERHYENFRNNIEVLGLDALVVIGGDGSIKFVNETCHHAGIKMPVICIPKTIDGDVPGLQGFSLGFKSARDKNADEIKSLYYTGRSMGMTHVIQIMGQHCGALTLHSAIKSKVADIVLIPEMGYNMESIHAAIETLKDLGQRQVIIVLAEGLKDLEGQSLGTIRYGNTMTAGEPNKYIAGLLQNEFPHLKIRSQTFTHAQRAPTQVHPHDLALGNYLGRFAVEQLMNNFNQLAEEPAMVAHAHSPNSGAWLIPLHEIANAKHPELKRAKAVELSLGHFVFGCEAPGEIRRILTHRNEWFGKRKGFAPIHVESMPSRQRAVKTSQMEFNA